MKPRMICSSMLLAGGVLAGVVMVQAQELDPLKTQEVGPLKMGSYEYDMSRVALPPDLTDTELAGRHLFVLRCAACHTSAPNSYGPTLNQERVKSLGDDGVRARIAMGSQRMPGFRYMFEPQQVDQILAYLKSIPPARRP